ncbi:hypothetical protein BC835DRAFT_1513201 [Cytidiella melzeri]|nr:hypothetical protein BC835DRAFT_1513201 [Cytidiella melzeri]
MKLQLVTILSAVLVVANAHGARRHAHHANIARQDGFIASASASSSAAAATSSSASSAVPVSSSPAASVAATSTPVPTASAVPGTGPAVPSPSGDISVPPLSSITSGMPTGTTYPVTTTYAPGAMPTYSGAVPLPSTAFVYVASEWPQPDKPAPTDSPQVQEWLKEIEGVEIPDIPVTNQGSCVDTPANAANSAEYGWWTCTGTVRSTDIVSCPDTDHWGVSYDDGPSPYSATLLKYLDEKNLKSTFFVVGSRAVERPDILIEEYMSGHEIGVHTWAHYDMTGLSNEQIVAELGWGREAIRRVLGVTPTIWRPPYGDVDDRVRAIATAMGLTTSIWTATPGGGKFDTNDWRVAGGLITGPQQFDAFESILGNASLLNTGFIVLQHDLFEITVDLAVGYTINAALSHNPPFTLEPIGQCNGIQTRDLYMETTSNQTYIAARKKATAGENTTATTSSGNSSAAGDSASGTSGASSAFALNSLLVFGALGAAAFALLI